MKKLSLVFLAFAWFFASSLMAAEKGWFGFAAKVSADGIFNPTVTSVKVSSIEAHSPAAEQSVAVGDEIIQIEATEVPGHKASELKPLMQKAVGETIHLRLKRPAGQIYSVTLIAVKRPA